MTHKEMLELYGEVGLTFANYYKYSFTFKGMTTDGKELMSFVGGSADDIYRLHVGVEPMKLKDLDARTVYLDGTELWHDESGW